MPTSLSQLQDYLEAGLSVFYEKWKFPPAKNWVTDIYPIDIDQDGDIEVLASSRDGRVYLFTRDGREIWQKKLNPEESPWVNSVAGFAGPSGQQGARIIAATRDGEIYMLSKDGELLPSPDPQSDNPYVWQKAESSILQLHAPPSFPSYIVYGSEDRFAYALDAATGKERWHFETNNRVRSVFTYDINNDGHLETLVGSWDKYLYILDTEGRLLTKRFMGYPIYSLFAADLEPGRVQILVGTRAKNLISLTPDLNEKWSCKLSNRALALTAVDVNNDNRREILVSTDDNYLTLLNDEGKIIWRHNYESRIYSFYTLDLDRDGHNEVLAGAQNGRILCWRVQLSKDIGKRITRSYTGLGQPAPETLSSLTDSQRDLLLDVLGKDNRPFDPTLHVASTQELIREGKYELALSNLRKLEDQNVQLLWQREHIGYLNALCFSRVSGDTSEQSKKDVIVGTLDGTISAFNQASTSNISRPSARLLWSAKFPDQQIDDVQGIELMNNRSGMDILTRTSSGYLYMMRAGSRRKPFSPVYHEKISCFYVCHRQDSSEVFLGTDDGQILLYTSDLQQRILHLQIPVSIQTVFAPRPVAGVVHSPEILVASDREVYAYTRGGHQLWNFHVHGRVLALYAIDLDSDGYLEILIGSEDRNIYVLDYEGNLRWRYYCNYSVQSLEVADLDGDGEMEVMAGCMDGVLLVFTATGHRIWAYTARDRIQGVRVADINQDGQLEIALILEDHLEVLQVVSKKLLEQLMNECWSHILADRPPFETLMELCEANDPYLRAAALLKLMALPSLSLNSLPEEVFNLFQNVIDTHSAINVRQALSKIVLMAYPSNPSRAREILDELFKDRVRDVRIQVIENLLLLVEHDWAVILSYLERAAESVDRTTRRAAIRKISHLIDKANEDQADQLFKLLLDALIYEDTQIEKQQWIKQEAASALAHLLNTYPANLLTYLQHLLDNQIPEWILRQHIAYNLVDERAQQAFSTVLTLCSSMMEGRIIPTELSVAVDYLEGVRTLRSGTDLWLFCREMLAMFRLASLEELTFHNPQFDAQSYTAEANFLRPFFALLERFPSLVHFLKTCLRRDDVNDRLSTLMDGMKILDDLQSSLQKDRKLSRSAKVGSLYPLDEAVANLISLLLTQWQQMFREQQKAWRGFPELHIDLPARQVHYEETIEIWLSLENRGHSTANNVKVTLQPDESVEALSSIFEIEAIFGQQKIMAPFQISPKATPVQLNFEVVFYDQEETAHEEPYHERLSFFEHQRPFVPIENPYSISSPASGPMFYGRDTELEYLRDNLARPYAQTVLVLYGQRRSGKTTLLYRLAQTALLGQHIAVLVDMQRLAYNLDLCSLLFKIAHAISKTLRTRGFSLALPHMAAFAPDPTFAFDLFLDELEEHLGERKIILLLDEFEILDQQVRKGNLQPEIFQYLRSVMLQRQWMNFLLAGTHHIEQLTRDYWSVFFNLAQHYRLPGRLDSTSASALITRPVMQSLEYETLAVVKIRQLTADQPYFIHLLCRALVDHCNQQRKNYASINDVNLVIQEVMATGRLHFDWLWEQLNERERVLLSAVAEGCRDEGRVLSIPDMMDICTRHHIFYSRDEITSKLKSLQSADVIEVIRTSRVDTSFDEAHFHISIGLLRQWLRREKALKYVGRNVPSYQNHSNVSHKEELYEKAKEPVDVSSATL